MSRELFIAGVPATFATKGETPWRQALESSIAPSRNEGFLGVRLLFTLPTLAPHRIPLDIDNLCEPVFSTLINRRGFFGGRRTNLPWWEATKAQGERCGVQIILEDSQPPDLVPELGQPFFSQSYSGPLPSSATDSDIPKWLSSFAFHEASHGQGRYCAHLDFQGSRINLGAIANGKVKTVIDCFYPLLGGSAGRPNDWRIDRLLVTKGLYGDSSSSVRVSLWDVGLFKTT